MEVGPHWQPAANGTTIKVALTMLILCGYILLFLVTLANKGDKPCSEIPDYLTSQIALPPNPKPFTFTAPLPKIAIRKTPAWVLRDLKRQIANSTMPITSASVIGSGVLADIGLITGKRIRDMANEWVMDSPSMLEDTPAKVELKRRILRRKVHITFEPLMKRANELSALIVIRIPPEYGSRRQDKDKEYADFFRKALNGYDYDNIEADKAGQYLIDISNELADSFRRSSETQK